MKKKKLLSRANATGLNKTIRGELCSYLTRLLAEITAALLVDNCSCSYSPLLLVDKSCSGGCRHTKFKASSLATVAALSTVHPLQSKDSAYLIQSCAMTLLVSSRASTIRGCIFSLRGSTRGIWTYATWQLSDKW